jgi:prepilin-type processing-associated H-X9-DG protein
MLFNTNWVLCPFMEQSAVYENLSSESREPYQEPFLSVNISSLKCPSDYKHLNHEGVPTVNIMVSKGDQLANAGYADYPHTLGHYLVIDANLAAWGCTNARNRGVFMPYKQSSLAAITDGTSNTAAISESVTNEERYSPKIKGGTAGNWDSTGAANTDGPQSCMLRRGEGGDMTRYNGEIALVHRGSGGVFWGRLSEFTFQTILPPNSPSCIGNLGNDWDHLMSATSHHPGGVNVGLCDGSARFVTDSIDCGDLTAIQPIFGGGMWSGASKYGVWGALGTPSGGESKSL